MSATTLPDYKDDPVAYETADKGRPDEIMMLDTEKVWPNSGDLCLTHGGNYVFVV